MTDRKLKLYNAVAVPTYDMEVSEALVIEKCDRNAIQSPETYDTVYLLIKLEIKTSRIS